MKKVLVTDHATGTRAVEFLDEKSTTINDCLNTINFVPTVSVNGIHVGQSRFNDPIGDVCPEAYAYHIDIRCKSGTFGNA